eukprot:gnl/Trimastix_PCT/1962.p1 GENE.gnl/Trimastix_PCT/1962~~gnl/Trimastix_PCT/1962.p1  ORF type:complete len:291 (-),score=88.80 gnl/Trimastix_PCT/1962:12-884(-)
MDRLGPLIDRFYLGDFQGAISDAQSQFSEGLEAFVFRCNLAQNKFKYVKTSIPADSSSVDLRAVRLMAMYLSEENKEAILAQFAELMANPRVLTPESLVIPLYATTLQYENQCEEADRVLNLLGNTNSLEIMLLRVQNYLLLNRPQLALREHGKMRQVNDDAILTQLAEAHTLLYQQQADEALAVYTDIEEKMGSTSVLLTDKAACLMMQKQYAAAMAMLREAVNLSSTNFDAVASLIACSYHNMDAPDFDPNRIEYLKQQLVSEAPYHPLVKKMQAVDAFFAARPAPIE